MLEEGVHFGALKGLLELYVTGPLVSIHIIRHGLGVYCTVQEPFKGARDVEHAEGPLFGGDENRILRNGEVQALSAQGLVPIGQVPKKGLLAYNPHGHVDGAMIGDDELLDLVRVHIDFCEGNPFAIFERENVKLC